jgi:voltage-dependent potassium channel beta subunit
MKYNLLGSTGIESSVFSIGTWLNFDYSKNNANFASIIDFAIDAGINVIDTAEIYGDGETDEVIASLLEKMVISRDSYILCSKLFWGGIKKTSCGLSRKHVREACDKILKKYNTDYIDIFICHREDFNTPVIETIYAMNLLIQQGKILYWGTSEWSKERLIETHLICDKFNLIPPSVEQLEYNLLNRNNFENNYIPLRQTKFTGSMIASPLAKGILTGKYNLGIKYLENSVRVKHKWFTNYLSSPEGKSHLKTVRQLQNIALDYGLSLTYLALIWLLKKNTVDTIILGCSTREQLVDNLRCLDKMDDVFSDELNSRVDKIIGNYSSSSYRTNVTYEEVKNYG